MPAGYSGTPLAKKLGIKEGHLVAVVNEPADFRELLAPLADGVQFSDSLDNEPDVVVAFNTRYDDFTAMLPALSDAVFPDRMIWLAWPKKASKVETDLTETVIREAVLETKLVDVKVCAISDIWSGLKIVWRKEHRG